MARYSDRRYGSFFYGDDEPQKPGVLRLRRALRLVVSWVRRG